MPRKAVVLMVLTLQLVAIAGTALAQEGSADPMLVKRYMELNPSPKQLIADMLHRMSAQKGKGSVNQQQLDHILSLVDFNRIDKALADSIARHFTNKELEALTSFLGSPEGQSYLVKQPAVSQDMSKTLLQEFALALKKFQEGSVDQQKGKETGK